MCKTVNCRHAIRPSVILSYRENLFVQRNERLCFQVRVQSRSTARRSRRLQGLIDGASPPAVRGTAAILRKLAMLFRVQWNHLISLILPTV